MKFKNIFAQAGLLLAIAASLYLLASIFTTLTAKTGARLEHLWEEDIANLTAEHKLPNVWNEIRQVEKIAAQNDLIADSWLRTVSTPIPINSEGEYKLEILFISQKDEGHSAAVIQHHLIHIPTGNSVWELGRTYNLD